MSSPKNNQINIIDTFANNAQKGENKKEEWNYQKQLQYTLLKELDPDFLEYDLHQIPFYKIERKFFFGGVKKALLVPVSMPHRVIVEANPPRQGYHSTWSSINEYYLRKSIKSEEDYANIMKECRIQGCKAHSENRSENGFVTGGYFATVITMLVIMTFICFTVVTEVFTFETESVAKAQTSGAIDIIYTNVSKTLNNVEIIAFCISIAVVFAASVYNWFLPAPQKIYIQYEDHLRALLNEHFEKLNNLPAYKNNLVFSISENPNKALWIEIRILDRENQMPFSEEQIQKHVEQLQRESDKEEDGLSKININLIEFKMTQNQPAHLFEDLNIYKSPEELKKQKKMNDVAQKKMTNRDLQIQKKASMNEKRARKENKDGGDDWQDA